MRDCLQRGLGAKRESKYVDFKGNLDFSEPDAWCEVVKDIVAMANSGGGVLLIGLDNRGLPTGFDPQAVLQLDEAKMTDQIAKYSGVQFDGFAISEEFKNGIRLAAIVVEAAPVPIVFTKPGTYPLSENKQKTAFSAGTVYFRHGAKSEPGETNDLRMAMERQLEITRAGWLKGVRRVITAPRGSQVLTFPAGVNVRDSASSDPRAIRIVDDPDAPAFRRLDYDITHPFRQKEATAEINRGLAGRARINSFDVQCINRVYDIQSREAFYHCPRYSSPVLPPVSWTLR
jgi:hypothetical protein